MQLSAPQTYFLTTRQPIALFMAGVGSGKTHGGGVLTQYFIEHFPSVKGFIGANTYNQLTTSTMLRIREVWYEYFNWIEGRDYVVGIKPPKQFNRQWHNFTEYNGIVSFKNGAIVFVGSLDNAKIHDGKEFGWAILDETKDSREEDVKSVILTRLRQAGMWFDGKKLINLPTIEAAPDTYAIQSKSEIKRVADGELLTPFNPLYILTSPAKVAWINDWFEMDEQQLEITAKIYDPTDYYKKEYKDKCLVISSTYHNQPNLPANYIDKIKENNTKEQAGRLIYGNPFVKAGGEFYSSFDRVKHVGTTKYNEALPIHISFDQNVSPYITMTVWQYEKVNDIRWLKQIDEICLSNPLNTTERLCLEFIRRYGRYNPVIFYYGDPSGRKSDTRANENDYEIVKRILKKYIHNKSDRVPYKHPPVIKRRDFANNVFDNRYDIRVMLDFKCKNSIKDFEFVKEDANGKKFKETKKDEVTKVTSEPFGHTSDTFDYILTQLFSREFERYME